MSANNHRAERVARLLRDVLDDDDAATAVCDLLSDVRHFCDRHGLDYADCDRRAYQNYLPELESGK